MLDNKEFGQNLRKLREDNELSVKRVVEQLANTGIVLSEKTLYGYEKGIRMPNADLFLQLCKIYKCNNILVAFGHLTENIITSSDLKLVKKYQSLDDDGKESVDFILNKEYKRCSSIDYAVTTSDDPHIIIEVAQAQRTLNAAHVDNNAAEENKKHDKAIIDNDNF